MITGTNRNKTLEEVTATEDKVTEDGWVKITVTGVEELKELLSRLPSTEFVTWQGGGFLADAEQAVSVLIAPPDNIVNEIIAYAQKCGFEFWVGINKFN